MFAERLNPSHIPPQALDGYLEKGWFRMGQSIFVTHFLQFNMQFFPAVWLRYSLGAGTDELIRKKLAPSAKRFSIRVEPWTYTPQQEELYAAYRQSVGLDMALTLQDLLLGNGSYNVYKTRQVSFYDGTQLIALGFFDEGLHTAAGISCIYHPDYRKYSLGKALIYAKMRYCMQQGIQWFYPGYAVPGYARFNYKLDIAPRLTEYYCIAKQAWLPYEVQAPLPNYFLEMQRHLSLLQEQMSAEGIRSTLMHYGQFDAMLTEARQPGLLGYPVFLQCAFDTMANRWLNAVYDVAMQKFKLVVCDTVTKYGIYVVNDNIVCTDILCITDQTPQGLDMQMVPPILQQMVELQG